MLRDERGSVAIEMVLLGPAFLLLLGLMIVGGRLALADQAMDNAAGEAARAATLSRGTDVSAAEQAARQYLEEQDVACAELSVSVDGSAKTTLPGEPARVTATVRCTVQIADLAVPGVSGDRTLTSTASSPLDTFRER